MTLVSAASVTTSASTFFSGLDFSKPTWDLFIVIFFVVAAFLYGMSLGRDRIIVILVSIYMALAVATNAPFLSQQTFQEGINKAIEGLFVLQISMFIFVFIVLFFLLSRSALMHTIASSDDSGPWWHVLLFSFLHVGLIISIVLSFLPKEAAQTLAPFTRDIFTSDMGKFIWIVSPIVFMVLIRSKKEKKFKYEI